MSLGIEQVEVTDEQIQQAAEDEWMNVLMSMWEAIGKDVDGKRLAMYARHFKIVPFELLQKSVDRAIRNNGAYLTVPSVGALWDAVRKETGNLPNLSIEDAILLWEDRRAAEFDSHVYRFEKVAI